MTVLVDLQKVSVRVSDRSLFEELSLTVVDGERVGVVGNNGTGKSTLLRILAGLSLPDEGLVRRGRGASFGYLEQDPRLRPGSVKAAVGDGWEADAVIERVGMGHAIGTDVARLSGGEAKRIALARALVEPADLLILDEPTNHLDLGAISWLEGRLASHRSALVLVTHDRHLLDAVTTKVIELDAGRVYLHEGGYASYLAGRAEREERAIVREANRANLARRELAWLRRGAPARTRKPRARLVAARGVVESRAERPTRPGELEMGFGTPRLGDKVIECQRVSFGFANAGAPVLDAVDLVIDRQERLGLVGANGSGKSTLLDLLAGRRGPNSGTIETGPTVVVGYYDQRGIDIDPEARVQDLVAGPTRVAGNPEDVALMQRFWFTGDLPFARAGTLSGGERRRLQLLLVLARRPNVLLLDEPTNDLDLDTLRTMEDFFETWPGALVVVSHDRTFLERTTDRLVALDAEGHLASVPGGLATWIARSAKVAPSGRPETGAKDHRPRRSRAVDGARSPSTIGRALREAEREIERLAERRDALATELSHLTDHGELTRCSVELAEVGACLVEAEERWLSIAEEAEARR